MAWIPVPKEIGKSVDQSIESKLTSPTKTMRRDSALLWKKSSNHDESQVKNQAGDKKCTR